MTREACEAHLGYAIPSSATGKRGMDNVSPKAIVRSAFASGVAQLCKYSDEELAPYDLCSVKVDYPADRTHRSQASPAASERCLSLIHI